MVQKVMPERENTLVQVHLARWMTREDVAKYVALVKQDVSKMAENRDQWDRTLVGALFSGWDDDPRELRDIPEARQLAQWAIDCGLLPVLDLSFSIPAIWPPPAEACWRKGMSPMSLFGLGAVELYCLARDYMGAKDCFITTDVVKNVCALMEDI